jgi:ubiquinone/menaquinone biosynthesis C-methylase UbiE
MKGACPPLPTEDSPYQQKNNFMQEATALYPYLNQPDPIFGKVKTWISASQHKTINSWIIEQLQVHPYQHILEVGYGQGNGLHEVARKLQVGFLAGVDESVSHYQQAARRNKKFMDNDLLHLHLGSVEELPYPPYYFNSIYAGNIYYSWNKPQYTFMQMLGLLKSGGKIITVVLPPGKFSEKTIWDEAEKIQQEYIEAGFFDVRFAFRELPAGHAISVVGYKE